MVVLLVNKFFFDKGGSERYFFMQADALEERGHDVVHFSMNHPDNRPSRWSSYFVNRREYDGATAARVSLRDIGGFIRSGEAARKLEALIADARPDVAHFHNIYHQLTPSIIPVLRRHRIPIVMTLHDYKLVCPSYRLFAHGEHCELCLGGRFYRAATTRCSDSSLARSTLLALEAYVQRVTRVYDGVYRFLAPSEYMRETFIRAGFDPDRIRYLPSFLPPAIDDTGAPLLPGRYIVYFGRLSDEKGLDTLLGAAGKRDDCALVLCGDGPERARLEARVERESMSSVHFTGHLDKAVLDAVVRGAAAAVLPAEWPENAPFGVLEAAMQGVPVIVSDMGGLPEMARIARGHVFPHGDVEALAETIGRVLSDSDSAARAREGQQAIVAHYNREQHLDALEAIYAEGIAETAR